MCVVQNNHIFPNEDLTCHDSNKHEDSKNEKHQSTNKLRCCIVKPISESFDVCIARDDEQKQEIKSNNDRRGNSRDHCDCDCWG